MRTDKGLHHITVIAGPPQQNVDFYIKKLGLRLVLKSVNQDDPGTYHFFYANGSGQPGSSLTFFPFRMASATKTGTGEATAVGFSVPEGAISFWKTRFLKEGVRFGDVYSRFGHNVLPFFDPDGLQLELVEDPTARALPIWDASPISEAFAIRGFWSVTLRLAEIESTAKILEEVMGFEKTETEGKTTLFRTGSPIGNAVILQKDESPEYFRPGKGTVHHIAFRANNQEDLERMRRAVIALGLNPTTVIDRHVFKSVYFQTPGGVLFEIASDDPGYASVVENEDDMGKSLFLPPWLESDRQRIEHSLEPVQH